MSSKCIITTLHRVVGSKCSFLHRNLNFKNKLRVQPSSSGGLDLSKLSTKTDDAKFVGKARSDFVLSQIVRSAADKRKRLFAVVFINGRQYKVSDGDVILIEHTMPVNFGERIKLEKVLLVGGRDFTLFGRPLLNSDLVSVHATVVEKTLSQPKIDYTKVAGKQIQFTNWKSEEVTMLRINEIKVDEQQLQV